MSTETDAAREGRITFARISELKLDPVSGNFDANHLREVHRRIFQDLPHHAPGGFRADAPGHIKDRALESTRFRYSVPYALRPELDQRLGIVLGELQGGAVLRGLDTNDFATRMSKLYSDLDHLHPFREGNSRTLRSFTEQLARETGHSLDWGTTNANGITRDNLYMARDFAVIQRAFPGIAAKDPAAIEDRNEYAAYLALGTIQKADRLAEIIRQSADRGKEKSRETGPLPVADVRKEIQALLPAARHQAHWDEERTRIAMLRNPSLKPQHDEAVNRQSWLDGNNGPAALLNRAEKLGITSVTATLNSGDRAIERIIGIGKALAAAERQRDSRDPSPSTSKKHEGRER